MTSVIKSDDELDLDIAIDNDECDNLQDAYDRLYQLSEELAKSNFKLHKKVSLLTKEKSKFEEDLFEARSQINQLKTHNDNLSEKLAIAEKEKDDVSNEFKTLLGKNSKLDKEVHTCIEEKKSLESKIIKLEFDLNASNVTLKKMNAGSKILDEILCAQKNSFDKAGLGYVGKPSTSKVGSEINFVKSNRIVPTPPKAKEINVHPKKTGTTNVEVKSFKFIPTCHHCGIVGHIRPNCFKLNRIPNSFSSFKPTCHHCEIIGHIRPNCAKLRNKKVNVSPKKKKIERPKIKSIWIRKSDLHAYDMEYDTLDDSVESRDFGLAL